MQSVFDILFRVDASSRIGTGHVMRCLALANHLADLGARCAFLARESTLGTLAETIRLRHALLPLPGDPPDSQEQDRDAALCTAALAGSAQARWLVVDHYQLDSRWEKAMRPAADSLMAIDDLADRPHDCELLLDQNLVANMARRYDGKLPPGCRQLLGPRHALLRPEFGKLSARSKPADDAPLRVLLMFGGADPQALCLRLLRILAPQAGRFELNVVAGSLFSRLDELRQQVERLPGARLHVATSDIAGLMAEADLAIGSPGVSSWERCSAGLATIAISQADNQEEIGVALAEAGAHLYLGRADTLADEDIQAALQVLCAKPWLRHAMSRAAGAICDGRGTARVARHLWRPALQLRRAELGDAALLFSWRNDERTRMQSLDTRELHYPGHLQWMEKMLADPDEILMLAQEGELPFACLRFSVSGQRARVSIYANPERHGQGLGSASLQAATEWLQRERPAVRIIEADVLRNNAASNAMFGTAGYQAMWTRFECPLSEVPISPAQRGEQRSD